MKRCQQRVHLVSSAEPVPTTDWHEVFLSNGASYFFNEATRQTSWRVPEEVKEARSRPPPLDDKTAAMLARAAASGAAVAPQYASGAWNAVTHFVWKGLQHCLRMEWLVTHAHTPSYRAAAVAEALAKHGAPARDGNGQRLQALAAPAARPSHGDDDDDDDVFFTEDDIVGAARGAAQIEAGPAGLTGARPAPSQADTPDPVEAFEELLASAGVHAFSRWERVLASIQDDPRFKVFEQSIWR